MEWDGQHNAHVIAWENQKYKTFGEKIDPNIKYRHNILIQVACQSCGAIHTYEIRVQGITGVRLFASRAVDCDHHCKSCGISIEPIPYIPDPEQVKLRRCKSGIRNREKNLNKNRVYMVTNQGVNLNDERASNQGYENAILDVT